MSDAFDALIGPLLAEEGGFVDDPSDPGGQTNFGITVAVARANGYTGPMAGMPQATAVAIYRAEFWTGPHLDQVAPLSAAIAAKLFDMGVNMGDGTGVQFLQRGLNVLNRAHQDYADIPVTGVVGPLTLQALGRFLTIRAAQNGEQVMLRLINGLEVAHYVAIAEARPASEAFEFGWLANRTAAVAA